MKDFSNKVDFTDGIDSEEYLSKILRESKDLSSNSTQLSSAIKDWPSEYHLSPVRHNLLRVLNFSDVKSVLEIGSGCGAITRFLGEQNLSVLAVEGSERRSEICKARCKDLSNVQVVSENFENYKSEQRYDLVTLIGVLEYAPSFSREADSVRGFLKKVFDHLADNSSLIIAIENKLGLKYFAGLPEDHLNRPYVGITGLYEAKGPVTLGKIEIENLLKEIGFSSSIFYYPFPDYKMPSVLISDIALKDQNFRAQDLLSRCASRSYIEGYGATFDETLAWDALAENKILGDLANSFLIVVNKGTGRSLIKDFHYASTFATHQQGKFKVETQFIKEVKDISVKKSLFNKDSPRLEDQNFKLSLDQVKYEDGKLYFDELKKILIRGGGINQVANWAKDWYEFLRSNSTQQENYVALPVNFVDATPYNFIRRNDRSLCFFDQEWQSKNPIPFVWVLIRGLVYSIQYCRAKPGLCGLTNEEFVQGVIKNLGFIISKSDFELAIKWEEDLNDFIYGKSWRDQIEVHLKVLLRSQIISEIGNHSIDLNTLKRTILDLESKLKVASFEAQDILSSRSWRLTAPLRVLKSLLIKG
ncbi:MAG: methyltransferase [bacterium]|nr:methyltransferase [bacterium]